MYIDIPCFFPVSPSFSFFTICSYLLSSVCVPYVVSISRLSTSIFSYVYFENVADAFLFYWIHVCFGDSMYESILTTSGIDLNTFQMMVCIVCD